MKRLFKLLGLLGGLLMLYGCHGASAPYIDISIDVQGGNTVHISSFAEDTVIYIGKMSPTNIVFTNNSRKFKYDLYVNVDGRNIYTKKDVTIPAQGSKMVDITSSEYEDGSFHEVIAKWEALYGKYKDAKAFYIVCVRPVIEDEDGNRVEGQYISPFKNYRIRLSNQDICNVEPDEISIENKSDEIKYSVICRGKEKEFSLYPSYSIESILQDGKDVSAEHEVEKGKEVYINFSFNLEPEGVYLIQNDKREKLVLSGSKVSFIPKKSGKAYIEVSYSQKALTSRFELEVKKTSAPRPSPAAHGPSPRLYSPLRTDKVYLYGYIYPHPAVIVPVGENLTIYNPISTRMNVFLKGNNGKIKSFSLNSKDTINVSTGEFGDTIYLWSMNISTDVNTYLLKYMRAISCRYFKSVSSKIEGSSGRITLPSMGKDVFWSYVREIEQGKNDVSSFSLTEIASLLYGVLRDKNTGVTDDMKGCASMLLRKLHRKILRWKVTIVNNTGEDIRVVIPTLFEKGGPKTLKKYRRLTFYMQLTPYTVYLCKFHDISGMGLYGELNSTNILGFETKGGTLSIFFPTMCELGGRLRYEEKLRDYRIKFNFRPYLPAPQVVISISNKIRR